MTRAEANASALFLFFGALSADAAAGQTTGLAEPSLGQPPGSHDFPGSRSLTADNP